ncbi:MAG: hypothetical protein JKX67_12520 [Colwellia sp.]|nr:hypothetical protein [Colwellia sp.]
MLKTIEKNRSVKARLIAFRKDMTLEEYEKHIHNHAGSIALEKAVAKFKEAQNEGFL